MARNDVYLNINALSPADAVVTGQQDMTAATVPELVLGDTPTFNFYFTDNTNVWPSWAGNASYTLTWALSDAVAGDFAPAATTGNATPITGGWSVILPLNSYDLVGLLNTKRVGQPYPVQNLWQQLRVTDPSGNEVTRAMFWTPVRYRAISDTQNTESASPTGGRFVTVNNVNTLTTPTAAQFYAANPVPTSALGSAANGELLIGNGTGFTKATLTAGSGVSITNGSGSITISATDGDITLDDGTAAAPSLKFTADTDTGIYRPSDNVVGISAGGVSRATFGATSAINGTTIPGSKTLVVTTDKLSALAATTSAELAGVISDETGSGALVFANTPTLVTPNIGAATGTSFNLTGSGTLGTTLTVNGTTDSSSKDTGAIVTEGGLGVEKSATIGGNLTVSGTGTSSVAGPLKLTYGTNLTGTDIGLFATSGGGLYINAPTTKNIRLGFNLGDRLTLDENTATFATNLTVSGGTITGGTSGMSLAAGGTNQNITLTPSGTGSVAFSRWVAASAAAPSTLAAGSGAIYFKANGSVSGTQDSWIFNTGYTDQTYRFQVAGTDRMVIAANTGNLLLKSDGVDSGNGKLQLATHTTSAGGIGFGSDVALFHRATGVGLTLSSIGSTTPYFTLDANGTNVLDIFGLSSDVYFDQRVAGKSLFFRTNGATLALTLDSSQNATFAKKISANGSTTWASASSAQLFWNTVTGANLAGSGSSYDVSVLNKNGDLALYVPTGTQNTTFAGAIAIGNTVQTAASVASTHKVTISIGGSTYYLLATNV